jgi:CubicO group peptidase (beta-lactamase class C family)
MDATIRGHPLRRRKQPPNAARTTWSDDRKPPTGGGRENLPTRDIVLSTREALGYSLVLGLGYLVEVLSGMPFDQFLAQRIFTPLQMKDTGFYVPGEKLARFASQYGPDAKGAIKETDDARSSRYARPVGLPSGGGGLVSTAQDYMRCAQMILNGGQLDGVRLLSPKTLKLMMTNHIPATLAPFADKYPQPDWNLRGYGWGLGFAVLMDQAKADILGSEGLCFLAGGCNVFVWIDPREELVNMVWTQFEPFCYYPLHRQFQVLVYQSLTDSYQK